MSITHVLSEVISMILREEFIGNKGSVNYYQMGGSIKRDDLYNLDAEGRPTRDPGLPGLKHRRKKQKQR